MIDPLASLFIRQLDQSTQNDISTFISVEEAIDCRKSNSRFFSLINRESQLKIIINEDPTIASCKFDGHEIVVDKNLYSESHETWAIGDRPFQKLSILTWNSHVRGSELILSSSNTNNSTAPHTSLHYELTRSNELNCIVKLKTIHLQHQVFYFNLNEAAVSRQSIDGHTVAVSCNGNMNRIQVQPTKLLCQCNKSTRILPQSFIGDIPFELMQHPEDPNSDDLILCDAIFSFESTCNLDYLQTKLQFQNRVVEFEVRSVKSINPSNNSHSSNFNSNGGNNNVSSSTHKLIKSFPEDLKQLQALDTPRISIEPSCSSRNDESIATSSSAGFMRSCLQENLDITSSETCHNINNKSQCNNSSTASCSTPHPSTMLRVRIRVTNFGVCIMPFMMINYICTWRFKW